MLFLSHNENETIKLAKSLAQKLKGGEIIALEGNLGSGKTIFSKGLAQGLKIKKIINSPTFVLMKVYNNKSKNQKIKKSRYFVHVDAYRISNAEELLNIGLDEYLGREDSICVIEWADKIKTILPKNTIKINFKLGKTPAERQITLTNCSK